MALEAGSWELENGYWPLTLCHVMITYLNVTVHCPALELARPVVA
jgi:hypothetical protein